MNEEKFIPERIVEELIHEVEDFLWNGRPESKEELSRLMAKLDTAIAITNSEKAKSLRQELIERFGDDAIDAPPVQKVSNEELRADAVMYLSIERIVAEAIAESASIDNRNKYRRDEIDLTPVLGSPLPENSEERVARDLAQREVDIVIAALSRFLQTHEVLTSKEREDILSGLDRAIAINNDSRAEKMRIQLINAWKETSD